MRKLVFLILLFTLAFLHAERMAYVAPEFMQSYYDHYTLNYMNTESMGMGYTGVAKSGNLSYCLLNPASTTKQNIRFYLEGLIKNEVNEFNKAWEDDPSVFSQKYKSLPTWMVGFSFPYIENGVFAFSYSQLQSITYDSFSREIKTGEIIKRKPEFKNQQLTTTINYTLDNFTCGLNAIVNYYIIEDYKVIYNFTNEDYRYYVFRLQPGLRYSLGKYSLGMSYKFAATENINVDEDYEVTLPGVLIVGVMAEMDTYNVLFDIEYEQSSSQSSEFDDRLKFRLGLEKDFDFFKLRGGLMTNPEIWTGEFDIPFNEEEYNEQNMPEDYIPPLVYGKINALEQVFLTGGVSVPTPYGHTHFSVCADISGNTNVVEGSFAIEVYLNQFSNLLKRN